MSDYHQRIDKHFELSVNSKEVYRPYVKSLVGKENIAVFVYEENKEVIGSIIVKIESRPPVYKVSNAGFIQEVSVSTEFQKKGIGLQLVGHAFSWLRDRGIKEVGCNYSPDNPKSSSFWEKLGFRTKTVMATASLE